MIERQILPLFVLLWLAFAGAELCSTNAKSTVWGNSASNGQASARSTVWGN